MEKRSKTGMVKRPEWAWPPPQVSVRAARTDGFVQLVPELPKMPRFPWMGVLHTHFVGEDLERCFDLPPNCSQNTEKSFMINSMNF